MSKEETGRGFKWWLLFCAFVFVPALVALGCWQLQRAAEKERMLKDWNDDRFVLTDLSQLSQLGDRSLVRADLDGKLVANRWLFLDNRTRHGHAGYEVIALLRTPNGSALLPVNLGWIQAPLDRNQLPRVDLPIDQHNFGGRLQRIQKGFLLADNPWEASWPKRIEWLDPGRLQRALGARIIPWVLEVAQPAGGSGLNTEWPFATMQPARHIGYAFQWFTMAAVLVGLLAWHWRRQRSPEVGQR